MTRGNGAWRRLVLMAALVPLTFVSSSAQGTAGGPIRVAWDANADPVAGYKVHVGTRSRDYVQIIDVRTQTNFTYETTIRGQRYYFAVSAYSADGTSSTLSNEVSATASTSPTGPIVPPDPDLPDLSISSVGRGRMTEGVEATCPDPASCYDVRVQLSGLELVSALAATSDGTLLFVERGQRVRLLSEDLAAPIVALVAGPGSRITDVVPDSAFAANHYVYVGVTQTREDLANDFSVVRYRLLDDRMSDAAVILSGLSSGSATPRVAMDLTGRLYVAIPELGSARSDLYAGKILRFNRDGTVPDGSRAASPIFAYGFSDPAGLDVQGGFLWARGNDDRPQNLMYLDLSASEGDQWPRVLQPATAIALDVVAVPERIASGSTARDTVVAYVDDAQVYVLAGSFAIRGPIGLGDARGELLAEVAATTVAGQTYVAVRNSDGSSSILSLISRH